jgi:hypothetical protein
METSFPANIEAAVPIEIRVPPLLYISAIFSLFIPTDSCNCDTFMYFIRVCMVP